jgi:hypothetical protein
MLVGFGPEYVRCSEMMRHTFLGKLGCKNKVCSEWFGVAPILIMSQLGLDLVSV